MITKIEINNINSIKHDTLALDKANYKYREEYVLLDRIANPIAFYGSNGSGKTSFLGALQSLVSLLTAEPDNMRSFIPNLSNDKLASGLSSIKIDMLLDGDSFSYEIFTNVHEIYDERLSMGRREIFRRKKSSCSYGKASYVIESKLYPALRFLANKLVEKNEIGRVFDYLSNIVYVGADNRLYIAKSMNNVAANDVVVDRSGEVRKILEKYRKFPVYDVLSNQTVTGEKVYSARIYGDKGSFIIPYGLMSNGMRNQSFLLSVLLGIPEHGVMVIDELEDALHPLTIMDFLHVALSRGVQVIFSSHNTNILSKLRPDNIVFAHWHNGSSTYKRLSEVYPNIREINNIEKMYLNSTFDEAIES